MLAKVQDLIDRYDRGLLADLARDDGTAESDLTNNPRILAALAGASGEVRSAILQGKRYSLQELQALEADDLAYLKDLVCALALLRLTAARVTTIGEETWRALRDDVRDKLEQLASGQRIFATAGAQEAGLPKAEGPLLVEMQRLNLLVDRCDGYYPHRGERWPHH